jgi:hypothetical protein
MLLLLPLLLLLHRLWACRFKGDAIAEAPKRIRQLLPQLPYTARREVFIPEYAIIPAALDVLDAAQYGCERAEYTDEEEEQRQADAAQAFVDQWEARRAALGEDASSDDMMTPSDGCDDYDYERGYGGGGGWFDAKFWGPDDFIPLTADDFIYGGGYF